VSVYLLTMGQGDEIWERFGHNALWIRDHERGTDIAYNWGLFDFREPNFIGRFLTGDTRYWMEGFDVSSTIETYRERNRSVWVQELRLTPAQRADLVAFLEWNARPENRYYRYDYYRDNCSTRVRDVIDRILGGALRQQTGTLRTRTTYRWHTQRLLAYDIPVFVGITLGLGRPGDVPLNAWEEMFLPERLRQYLRQVVVPDSTGAMVPLVVSERQLFAARRAPEPAAPPRWLPWFALTGVALAALVLVSARGGHQGSPWRRVLIGGGIGWSLICGIASLMLIIGWAFTRHFAMADNASLWQTSPLSLVLAFLIPRLLRGDDGARALRWVPRSVATLAVIGALLECLPGLHEHNAEIIVLVLPVQVALAVVLTRARGAAAVATPTPREAVLLH